MAYDTTLPDFPLICFADGFQGRGYKFGREEVKDRIRQIPISIWPDEFLKKEIDPNFLQNDAQHPEIYWINKWYPAERVVWLNKGDPANEVVWVFTNYKGEPVDIAQQSRHMKMVEEYERELFGLKEVNITMRKELEEQELSWEKKYKRMKQIVGGGNNGMMQQDQQGQSNMPPPEY